MAKRFTATHMVNGVLRALADRGYSTFLIRTDRLDAAFEAAYKDLVLLAPEYDLDVHFAITRDDFGESQTLRSALNAAAQRDVVSFDNPEYQDMRLDRHKVASTVRFESLPGDRALYDRLADVFVKAYEASSASEDTTRLAPT